MISGIKQLTAALLAIALALGAYYVIAMPLPIAIYYATDSSSPGWHRFLARLRSRAPLSCPQHSDFPVAGPLVHLLAAMDMEDEPVDVTEAKAIFRHYVERGCDINAINDSGSRPIHAAILFRNPDLLKFVIELGGDPNQKTGPESNFTYDAGFANLDASAYLAELCTRKDAKCDELRAILANTKR